jgi:hypothetical protein
MAQLWRAFSCFSAPASICRFFTAAHPAESLPPWGEHTTLAATPRVTGNPEVIGLNQDSRRVHCGLGKAQYEGRSFNCGQTSMRKLLAVSRHH